MPPLAALRASVSPKSRATRAQGETKRFARGLRADLTLPASLSLKGEGGARGLRADLTLPASLSLKGEGGARGLRADLTLPASLPFTCPLSLQGEGDGG